VDIIKKVGDGVKQGAESIGNALGNASKGNQKDGAQETGSGDKASKNPIKQGASLVNQAKDRITSGIKDVAENASSIFDKGDSVEKSDELKEEDKKEAITDTGDVTSLIKTIASAAGKIPGGTFVPISFITSAIANDGYANVYDMFPAALVNLTQGRIGDNNEYTDIC